MPIKTKSGANKNIILTINKNIPTINTQNIAIAKLNKTLKAASALFPDNSIIAININNTTPTTIIVPKNPDIINKYTNYVIRFC